MGIDIGMAVSIDRGPSLVHSISFIDIEVGMDMDRYRYMAVPTDWRPSLCASSHQEPYHLGLFKGP